MGYAINDMKRYVAHARAQLLQTFEREQNILPSVLRNRYSNSFHEYFNQEYLNSSGADDLFADWKGNKDQVRKFQKRASENKSTLNYLYYCYTLLNAIEYLEDKEVFHDTPITTSRREFLERNIDFLKTYPPLADIDPPAFREITLVLTPFQQLHLDAKEQDQRERKMVRNIANNIARPVVKVTEKIAKKTEKAAEKLYDKMYELPKEEALVSLLESKEFKAIEDYANNVLKNDTRSHSFFCIQLGVRKYERLNAFIEDLKTAVSVQELKNKFEKFYAGREMDGSLYTLLNTGQNITTKLCGYFGFRTTTIEKIDDFFKTVSQSQNLATERTPLMGYFL